MKYDFQKILSKYNADKNTNYVIVQTNISDVNIVLSPSEILAIEFLHKDFPKTKVSSIKDFLYYHVRDSITDRQLSAIDFENFIVKTLDIKSKFSIEIWPPLKIRYAYYYKNYSSEFGTLGKSCMRTKEMQKSLNFYVQNNVKIVVVIDNVGKVHARALLWEGVRKLRNKSTYTYLDRIYYNSSLAYSMLLEFGEVNKWEIYPSISAGEAHSYWYITDVNLDDVCHLPYTDTFKKLYYKDKIITAGCAPSQIKHCSPCLTLSTTANYGYFPELDQNSVQEVFTGNYISKKDATYIKRYEGHVLNKNIADINGNYYSVNDPNIIQSHFGEYLLKENMASEAITGNILDKTTAIYSDYYKGHVHKTNAVEIKGILYHSQDKNIVRWGGEWYHISECFDNYDRKNRNKDIEKQVCTPGGNPVYFHHPSCYVPYELVTAKNELIPKKHAVIAYDLIYNPILDNIEYQEVYCKQGSHTFIELVTGELILSTPSNKVHLKKFNNKYYIKHKFSLHSKNQMKLFTA